MGDGFFFYAINEGAWLYSVYTLSESSLLKWRMCLLAVDCPSIGGEAEQIPKIHKIPATFLLVQTSQLDTAAASRYWVSSGICELILFERKYGGNTKNENIRRLPTRGALPQSDLQAGR